MRVWQMPLFCGCSTWTDPSNVNCGVVSIPLPGLPLGVASGGAAPAGFRAFFAGPENRLVEPAVAAVLDAAIAKYNPLLLWGASGTGKSHIARGLAEAWRARHGRRRRVEYVVASDFARELNDAIAAQAMDDFHTKYRRAALLVIEDVARLDGRQAVQEELLYTFDALLAGGGRLIATAGTAPARWSDFLPAVTARLTSGLVVPLRPPSKTVRRMLLEQLATMTATAVGDGVLDVLADQLEVSAPELLGALVQLQSPALLDGEPADVRQAKQFIAGQHEATRPALPAIAAAVAKQFGVKLSLLRGPSRRRAVVVARDAAIYLARELNQTSFVEIGRYFGGRDHTTVLHGYHKLQELLGGDAALQQAVDTVEKALRPC